MLVPVSIHHSFSCKIMFTSGVKRTDLKAVSAELKVTILTSDLGVGGPPFLDLVAQSSYKRNHWQDDWFTHKQSSTPFSSFLLLKIEGTLVEVEGFFLKILF